MRVFTDSIRRRLPCAVLTLVLLGPVVGNETTAAENSDVDSRLRPGVRDAGPISVSSEDRRALEQYREKAAGLALRTDKALASSEENAALLYYQALLARREPDPETGEALNLVARGGEPDTRVRAFLGRHLATIELAQIASQMPRCDWGPLRAGEQQLDFNLGIPLRRLSRILDADARALAADGHARAALARCLTLRRLAHHTGDETYNLFSISQSIHTLALLATAQVLSTKPVDAGTLAWLKSELAAVPGTPFEPAPALRKWREAGLAFWRTRPTGRAFTRELVLDKIRDADDRNLLALLTDKQLQVIALQGEQRVPGLYGISAPPELLERARQACDEYLTAAMQVMNADLSYRDKHAKLQEMVDSLDDRAADGDPIALLSEAPKVVEIYHRLQVRNAVYDNLVAAAIEICVVKASTGQLPKVLPAGLPNDLYTKRDFGYERTARGFTLRFDPENLSRIRVRQFEFRTPSSSP
jgi:hypothetical protein